MTSSKAQVALRAAESAAARMRRPARWLTTYTAVFGMGFVAMTLLLGLSDLNRNVPGVLPAMWGVLMVAMMIWARRQRASVAGIGRRVAPYWIVSGLLYLAALVVGVNRFHGEPSYWIPAAVVVGAPLIVGAWRESRA